MATKNRRIMRCTPDDVFATLADGWVYPSWVVGATRMRAVDPEWPAEGSRIYHSLGFWPIMVDDTTEVIEWDPPRRARLQAKAGPLGRAVVVIDVREHPAGCSVGMGEEPVGGAASALPRAAWAPALKARNRETLLRLAYLAEGRRHERDNDGQTARESVPRADGGSPSAQARADGAEATDATAEADAAHDSSTSGPDAEGPAPDGNDAIDAQDE